MPPAMASVSNDTDNHLPLSSASSVVRKSNHHDLLVSLPFATTRCQFTDSVVTPPPNPSVPNPDRNNTESPGIMLS